MPVMPPAPGKFSMTTGWPSAFDKAGLAARMMVSTPEPGPTGTMTRIGVCAWAGSAPAKVVTSAATSAARRVNERCIGVSWSSS